MEYIFLDREDFNLAHERHSKYAGVAGIIMFPVILIIIELLNIRYLIPFDLFSSILFGLGIRYFAFRRWRDEMVETGHIDYKCFDEKAIEYKCEELNYFKPFGLILIFSFLAISIWASWYLKSQQDDLNKYGQITTGKVIKMAYGRKSDVIIEFSINGQKFTARKSITKSGSKLLYYDGEKYEAKIGDRFYIKYSSIDPKNNSVASYYPINQTRPGNNKQ